MQQSEDDLVYKRRSKFPRRIRTEGVKVGSQTLDMIVFRGGLAPPFINGFSIGSSEQISVDVLTGALKIQVRTLELHGWDSY
jgi:hypothetical protein